MAKPSRHNPPAFGGQFYDLVLYLSFLWQAVVCETLNLNLKPNTHQFSFRHLPSITLALVSSLISSLVSSLTRRITCSSNWMLFGGPQISPNSFKTYPSRSTLPFLFCTDFALQAEIVLLSYQFHSSFWYYLLPNFWSTTYNILDLKPCELP